MRISTKSIDALSCAYKFHFHGSSHIDRVYGALVFVNHVRKAGYCDICEKDNCEFGNINVPINIWR
jgi:hypothetical protein